MIMTTLLTPIITVIVTLLAMSFIKSLVKRPIVIDIKPPGANATNFWCFVLIDPNLKARGEYESVLAHESYEVEYLRPFLKEWIVRFDNVKGRDMNIKSAAIEVEVFCQKNKDVSHIDRRMKINQEARRLTKYREFKGQECTVNQIADSIKNNMAFARNWALFNDL